jgi:predicted secreted protein
MVTWWVVLFAVLPFGVVSQHEKAEPRTDGTDPGAPVRPLMVRKALITTVIAGIIWLGIAYVVIDKPISFDDIPFMPKSSDWMGAHSTPQP